MKEPLWRFVADFTLVEDGSLKEGLNAAVGDLDLPTEFLAKIVAAVTASRRLVYPARRSEHLKIWIAPQDPRPDQPPAAWGFFYVQRAPERPEQSATEMDLFLYPEK
jgi:hypothetical protein